MSLAGAPVRILCIGNRLVAGDDLGPRVHDRLAAAALPAGVELIDGGVRGLDLLRLIDGCRRVIFVDAVSGFGPPGTVLALPAAALAGETPAAYGHAGGLNYLLEVAPMVCTVPLPMLTVVGIERGDGQKMSEAAAVEQAAWLCRKLAAEL
jgi:hydrogenase maturation protease